MRLVRVGVVAALALVTLSVPAFAQQDTPRPAVWSGVSMAAGGHVIVNTDPSAVPVRTLLDGHAPSVSSEWNSQGVAAASAAAFDPGASVTGGPQLLCDFGLPCPDGFPPDYPLDASASHPGNPDASSPTGLARAHAGRDFVAATGKLGNAVPLDPLRAAIEVGAATTTTRQEFVDGVLTVTARTSQSDVRLGGGVVTIDSIESVAASRATGSEDASSSARMTVAGIRTQDGTVVVGREGVTVGGQGTDGGRIREVNSRLASALEGSGVSVRVLGAGTTRSGDGAATDAHVFGLAVEVRREISGPSQLPAAGQTYRTYVLEGVLAQAGTTAYATNSSFGIASTDITVPQSDSDASGGADAASRDVLSGGTATEAGSAARSGLASGSASPPAGDPSTSAAGGPRIATSDESSGGGFALLAGDAATWVVRTYLGIALLAGVALIGGRMLTRRLLP